MGAELIQGDGRTYRFR